MWGAACLAVVPWPGQAGAEFQALFPEHPRPPGWASPTPSCTEGEGTALRAACEPQQQDGSTRAGRVQGGCGREDMRWGR